MSLLDQQLSDRRIAAVEDRSGWQTLERVLCLTVLFLLGWRLMVRSGVTVGHLAALLSCPLWIGLVRRYRHGMLIFVSAGLTYAGGLALAAFAPQHHRHVSVSVIAADSALWIGIFAGVGVLLWARTILSLSWIGVAFGLGMLLRNVENIGDGLAPTNPWKFVFALPVAVILLAMAQRGRRRLASLVVLLALAGVSAVLDSRSMFGILLLAAVLVAWQLRPATRSRPIAWGWTLALVGGLAIAIYNLATALMLDGYLGEEVAQRSQLQVATAGSLILGGRPEIAASWAMFVHDPLGFGLGVAPNLFDVMTAKNGMLKINYDPANGYVENYMFGGHVELHSVAGDLWAKFGLFGLAMAILLALLMIRGVARSLSAREGNGLLIFVVIASLWNLAFSPLYTSEPTLILALGLMLNIEHRPRPAT